MKNVFLLESNSGFMKLKIFQLHYQKIFESGLKLNFDLFVFLVSSDNYARMLLVQWRKIQHWKRRSIQKHIEDQNDRHSKKLESLRKLINNIKLKVFFINKTIFSPLSKQHHFIIIQWFWHFILAERRKKKRHQDYLLQIINHQKEFQEFHRNVRNKLQRSNRALIAYYTNSEARMKREQERLEKERMRRLMAEDEEGYRKLIDKARFILDG